MSYSRQPSTEVEIPAVEAHLHKGCLEVLKLALRDLHAKDGLGIETRRRIAEHIKALERASR